MRQKREQMKYRYRKFLIPAGALVTVVIIGIILYRIGADSGRADQTAQEQTQVKPKTEFTEEEKAALESQTGVTVREDGVVEVNVAERMEAEENVAVKREDAQEKVLRIMSEDAQILSAGLQNEADATYWIVRAQEGDNVFQVWVNADTGDIFQSKKE